MQSYIKAVYAIIIATIVGSIIGVYGMTVADDGFFVIFGQAFSLYLFIVHPALLYFYGRAIIKLTDHKEFPEAIIFVMISIPFFPIVYTLIPLIYDFFTLDTNVSATDIIFVIFEVGVLGAGFAFFINYTKRYVLDQLVPKDLYAIHHYLIGTLLYFYFIRLTILSSILVTGAF